MGRLILAGLLAPGFVASLIAIVAAMRGSDPSSEYFGTFVFAFFLFAYIIAIVPTLIVVIALKVMSYSELWHFVIAGFFTGFACALFFTLTGYSSLLDSPAAWFDRASSYLFLLPIGALAGAFVWFVGEWQPRWLARD